MLFIRLSWPANVPPPPYCGVRREMSLMRPDTVGSDASSSRRTAVAAPVRDELNTTSDLPTTVTVSLTADSFSENVMSVLTPRLTTRPSWTSVLNPASTAVALYGPPTRMFSMKNRPSPCVTASYVVPEGTCTTLMLTPGTTAFCASRATPAIDPVVTPCAATGWATASSATPSAIAHATMGDLLRNCMRSSI